jgi:mannosyl-oligosaccharide alpha-1,2-mannosidase
VEADVTKREAVKEATRDAFAKYEEFAMGMDELQPLTRRGKNNFGGLGATVIDSLDTLWIMGLSDQYSRARNWVANQLHFNKNYQASVFETTIRIVGGLVAAYDLSVGVVTHTPVCQICYTDHAGCHQVNVL